MKRVLEYKIISDNEPDAMQKSVNDCLGQGWQPLGGVSCGISESDEYYYTLYSQALVRYSNRYSNVHQDIKTNIIWQEIE